MANPHRGPKKGGNSRTSPLTHFLCLPLTTEGNYAHLQQATTDIGRLVSSSSQNHEPVPADSLRPAGSLHCTLGVMRLTDEQLPDAIALLESLDLSEVLRNASPQADPSSAVNTLPIVVSLKGLHSMHAPEKTSVLYTVPTDPTNRLHPFCIAMQELFKRHGYVVDDKRELKLHTTIVNTIYAKHKRRTVETQPPQQPRSTKIIAFADDNGDVSSSQQERNFADATYRRRSSMPPLKIDARTILDECYERVWATGIVLDRIAICEMGAKKKYNAEGHLIDEHYKEIAVARFPTHEL